MPYQLQKMVQQELDERIPRGLAGSPQNVLRYVVNSQRLHGKSFAESLAIAMNFVRERYPDFTPRILTTQ